MFMLTLFALAIEAGSAPPGPVAWRTRADDPERVYLFVDGRQRGGYDVARDEWRSFDPDSGRWLEARPLFPQRAAARAAAVNFGVMRDRIDGAERWTVHGRPAPADTGHETVNAIPDDSQLLRLTLIGTAAECRFVLNDLEHQPVLAALHDRLVVQCYDPDHWAVAGAGFVRTGRPTIYVQAPDGRVLHRQDEYRGADGLAAALRRADPNYRPDQDPDLNAMSDWPRPGLLPRWAWAAVALVVLLFLSHWRTRR